MRILTLPLDRVDSKGAVLAAGVGAVLGWMNKPVMLVMLGMALLDIVTGIMKARAQHAGESGKFFKGVYRLIAYWVVGTMLMALGSLGPVNMVIADAMSALVIFGEMVSVIENLHVAGNIWGVELPGIPLLVRALKLNQEKLLGEIGAAVPAPAPPTQNGMTAELSTGGQNGP